MHIAHIHWAFPPIIGGVESHLAMLGPELVKNNCSVSLLTGAVEGEPEEHFYEGMFVKRTPFVDLNSLSPEKIERQRADIKREIERFVDKVKPDIIHAHNMHYFSPVHADILNEVKLAAGIPLVLTAHNVWADEDPVWQEMNQRAHIWDAVIAVSHYIKKELVRSGYKDKRVTALHHGIDLGRFKPAGERDFEDIKKIYPSFAGRRVIFHPARMSLDKGCHISVEALALIRKEFPNVLLVLAGTGKTVDWGTHQQKHVRQIMGRIDELGLKDNVFVRFFAWKEMPLVYTAAEFAIYPSCFEEPFGLVMLEAMASEKPVIVSHAGGMPEVIQDGVNGFVVPMFDPVELADRCCDLLRKPETCRKLGLRGREMVQQYWTKEIMTRAHIGVYKKVIRDTNKTVNLQLA